MYQLGLQAASTLISSIDCNMISNDEIDTELKKKLFNVLGPVVATGKDFDWICQAILGALCMQYVSVPVLRAGGVILTLILQFCPHLFFIIVNEHELMKPMSDCHFASWNLNMFPF